MFLINICYPSDVAVNLTLDILFPVALYVVLKLDVLCSKGVCDSETAAHVLSHRAHRVCEQRYD
nr:hypothetical protein Iba_chr01aCG9420 [Ipomoea batatas]